MMRKNKYILSIISGIMLLSGFVSSASAKEFREHWEKKVFAGYNIGGTSPIPLPAEIRQINSWKPGFGGTLAFHLTRWITPEWGLTTGLAIDLKGMKIDADVKYLQTSLVVGEGDRAGQFTGSFNGKNKTNMRNDYLVLPVLAAWRPVDRWRVRLGGYVAFQNAAKFEGTASDGYIRNGGPTGEKINVESATYDFAEEVRSFDAGLMASGDWFFTEKMALTGQLSWGLVPIFPSDFEGLSYKMYNIYFSLGVAYKL